MRREHPADYFMVVLAVFFCTLLMAGLVGCGGGDEDDGIKPGFHPVSCDCQSAPPPEFCPLGPPTNCKR